MSEVISRYELDDAGSWNYRCGACQQDHADDWHPMHTPVMYVKNSISYCPQCVEVFMPYIREWIGIEDTNEIPTRAEMTEWAEVFQYAEGSADEEQRVAAVNFMTRYLAV